MAVIITKTPDTQCANPVENEICFGFEPDDYKINNGVVADVLIQMDATFINNLNGETVTILGQTFTVDNSSPSTFNTFDGTTANHVTNADNLFDMIEKSYYFKDFVLTRFSLINEFIQITDTKARDRDDWIFDFSGLTNPPVFVLITNGVDPEFVDGYKIFYQLYDQDGENALCPLQTVDPFVDADGNVQEFCVDFQNELSRFVRTSLPKLTAAVGFDLTVKSIFCVRFGNLVSNVDCGNTFQFCDDTGQFEIVNAAIQQDNPLRFSQYCFLNPAVPILFMSARPRISSVCKDTYVWLWLCLTLTDFYSALSVDYFWRVEEFLNGALLGTNDTLITSTDTTAFIPSGPANLYGGFLFGNTDKYTARVFATVDNGIDPPFNVDLSETMTFNIGGTCCKDGEFYFLSEPGGYDTICFEDLQIRALVTEQTEICTDVACGGSYITNLHNEGKRQINTKARELFTYTTRQYQRTQERLDFFIQFKKSESRFIRIVDKNGDTQYRQFLIQPGSVQIFEKDSKIQMVVVGTYGSDLKQQSEY